MPVLVVDRNELRHALDQHIVAPPLLDRAELGTNQVWVATFTPRGGLYVQRIESLPLARGGAA